jgi:uncharacterized protein
MSFRRALRWFFGIVGLLVALLGALAAYITRLMVAPPRQGLWANPGDLGLDYEDVHFPAQDGVRIAGWFIPAANSVRKGATIILVHGWLWNRLGMLADTPVSDLMGGKPVDLLRMALALHRDGYHVLMYDLRNHGESAAAPPVAFGQEEAKDLLGALGFLNGRSDIDPQRIGVMGFSMGANALLYALPQTDQIQAAVAVQPTTVEPFSQRFGHHLFGPVGNIVLSVVELLYQAAGGLHWRSYQPSFAAAGAGKTPVLFVQGNGDRWGDVEDVARMAEVAPNGRGPLFVDTSDRFEGYQYPINKPGVALAFFEQEMPE